VVQAAQRERKQYKQNKIHSAENTNNNETHQNKIIRSAGVNTAQ